MKVFLVGEHSRKLKSSRFSLENSLPRAVLSIMFDAYLPISRLGCGIFVLKRFDDLSYICIGFIYKLIEVTMYEFRAVALSDVWNVSSIKCGSRTNNICIIRKNIYNYGPNSRSNANFSFQFIFIYMSGGVWSIWQVIPCWG